MVGWRWLGNGGPCVVIQCYLSIVMGDCGFLPLASLGTMTAVQPSLAPLVSSVWFLPSFYRFWLVHHPRVAMICLISSVVVHLTNHDILYLVTPLTATVLSTIIVHFRNSMNDMIIIKAVLLILCWWVRLQSYSGRLASTIQIKHTQSLWWLNMIEPLFQYHYPFATDIKQL